MLGRKYSDGYSKFPDSGLKITDKTVARFVKLHTHWWDRLDYHKICDITQIAFAMLSGSIEIPKRKRWYF